MNGIKLLLIGFLFIKANCESRVWSPLGSPLIQTTPCKNTDEIAVWLEAGTPLHERHRYYVYVTRTVPADSVAKVSFDLEANVTFSVASDDGKFSKISLPQGDIFTLRFPSSQPSLGLTVQSLTPADIPHLISLTIDDVELCMEPDVSSLQYYVDNGFELTGGENQWHAESSRSKKALLRRCGRRTVDTELTVDGEAKLGDWPWFAAIYLFAKDSLRYICAGTLISVNSVLTAGHCVIDRKPEDLIVLVGRYELENWSEEYVSRQVDNVITPPTNDTGIAILKFKKDVPLSDSVKLACLWNSNVLGEPDDSNGTIIGWGYDDEDQLLDYLQQANMPMVPRDTCLQRSPRLRAALNSNYFCAGFHDYGTSACNGDNGIPFLVFIPYANAADGCKVSGAWHVRGVLSLASSSGLDATCDRGYAVFTDVDKFKDWIREHLN